MPAATLKGGLAMAEVEKDDRGRETLVKLD
jgi:hypothetical protein